MYSMVKSCPCVTMVACPRVTMTAYPCVTMAACICVTMAACPHVTMAACPHVTMAACPRVTMAASSCITAHSCQKILPFQTFVPILEKHSQSKTALHVQKKSCICVYANQPLPFCTCSKMHVQRICNFKI